MRPYLHAVRKMGFKINLHWMFGIEEMAAISRANCSTSQQHAVRHFLHLGH